MATYNNELSNVLRSYINLGESKERLKQLLQTTPAAIRYDLLMTIRGSCSYTGLHRGSRLNELKIIKHMINGFTAYQKYTILKSQDIYRNTALHDAAYNGDSPLLVHLLTDLSEQQKYNLLTMQNSSGSSPLHLAAHGQKTEVVSAILSSVSVQLQMDLLNIKNDNGQTITDIRPELYNDFPGLVVQGIFFAF